MTASSSGPVPAVPIVPVPDPADEERAGETVGASDADADRARAAGENVPTGATRDSDGVPVGEADAEEDARRSGA